MIVTHLKIPIKIVRMFKNFQVEFSVNKKFQSQIWNYLKNWIFLFAKTEKLLFLYKIQ